MVRYIFVLVLSFGFFFSCKKTTNTKNEVEMHLASDPDRLLPYVSAAADATHIERYLFQKLIDWDFEKEEFVGILAVSRPKITITSAGMRLDYEIRPEAKWDNDSAITAADVIFTYKAILNPKSKTEHYRVFYESIRDVQVDLKNPKKFSVITSEPLISLEQYTGFFVLPEYAYDPNHVLRKYSIKELTNVKDLDRIKQDSSLTLFSDQFNDQRNSRDPQYLIGSGAYRLETWNTASKIILTRKSNWWGRSTNDSLLKHYGQLDKLRFRIINDWNTASTAMKSLSLEGMKSIEFRFFDDLKKEKKITENFNFYTPTSQQYTYIGMNVSNPKLSEISVRKAIAHSVDKKQLIDMLLYGYGTPLESMVTPDRPYYHRGLKPCAYNILLANQILDSAGWKDTDGNGIREKIIEGKKIELELEYKYNAGNETRKNIGLILKENLKKIGIELSIVNKEWSVFLEDMKNHQFELNCGAWVGDPMAEDPKQIWHTSSARNGFNYVNYGDAASDRLIDQIRSELDPRIRDSYFMKLQEKVHDEVPYIFLFSPLERIAIHKRFQNANAYKVRPGIDLGLWKTSK